MSEAAKITGTIQDIGETVTFPSGFCKREFAVVTNAENYPQYITLEVIKEKCADLDRLQIGQGVCVSYNLRGNYSEKAGRGFNSLHAWRIEAPEADAGAGATQPTGGSVAGHGAPDEPGTAGGAPGDNLPF